MISRTIILKRASLMLMCVAAIMLSGCDDDNPKPAQPKTNQFETGRFALQKMVPAAHLWSADAEPIQLASSASSQSNGHDGKAGFWRATFASHARQKAEPFSWSGIADTHRGVDHGIEDSYNPSNRSMQTWDFNFLKIDSDQAFEVGQQHGGKQLLEKDPKLPVTYLLDFDASANQLRWHVIYGETAARVTVLVDASTGQFLHKE